MVLAKEVHVKGTGELGTLVMYKILPAEAAKIVVEGLPTEPVGLKAESLKVQPAVLLPR